MVAFDNTLLSLRIFPDAEQHHGKDAVLVEYARERVLGLVRRIEDQRERVVVPTPELAELLVTDAADVQEILTTLYGSAFIRVASFDERAAVELAMRLRDARRAGDQRKSVPTTKTEMKFDRQIVAIALVYGASVLYSDDTGVASFAAGCGSAVKRVAGPPIPASPQSLAFSETEEPQADDGSSAEEDLLLEREVNSGQKSPEP